MPYNTFTEGWIGPTAGLVDLEKRKNLSLMGLELAGWLVGWSFRRLVRSLLVCCLVGSMVS